MSLMVEKNKGIYAVEIWCAVRAWKVLDFLLFLLLRLVNIAILVPKTALTYQSEPFIALADGPRQTPPTIGPSSFPLKK